MKPLVGVMPLWDNERESIWMLPGYLEGLAEAGAIPVILPMRLTSGEMAQLDGMLDGYLLTGGHDVNPGLYGEVASPQCGAPCDARDRLERAVYEKACEKDKPVLGICRGLQFINVLHGGTLYQDLPTQYQGGVCLEHRMPPPYDRGIHAVQLEKESPLYRLLGQESLLVNSYHHQAVKDLGEGLEVMARAQDGLIEGVYRRDKRFVWGVQWHPEFSYKKEESQRKIFEAFVKACVLE